MSGDKAAKKPQKTSVGRQRVLVLAMIFVGALGLVGVRLMDLAARGDQDKGRQAAAAKQEQQAEPKARGEILDRNGLVLATNLPTYELYFDASVLHADFEREEAAREISEAFDDLDYAELRAKFGRGGTHRLLPSIKPDDAQRAHNLGQPGLYLRKRAERIYPAGRAAAHLVGWTNSKGEGQYGVEGGAQKRLASADGGPVRLTIDLRAQQAAHEILAQGVRDMSAKAGVAIVMEADTGRVAAMVSLPDYDPHHPPQQPASPAQTNDHPLFHRAVTGVYELGSVFKTFTWALALEAGVADVSRAFPAPKPISVGRFTIKDDHPIRTETNFTEAFAKSSNIIAAQLSMEAGGEAQRAFFELLGFFDPQELKVLEAGPVRPIYPEARDWRPATIATAAYGHGVAVTPAHVAAAMASVVNGGFEVRPSLVLAPQGPPQRILKEETSLAMRRLLRAVVTDGTGKRAEVEGLRIGGKTGTANKPDPKGGYYKDRVIASFVSAFPIDAPAYVVMVTLDEPVDKSGRTPSRGAGRTAAPVAARLIERLAPILGVRPGPEQWPDPLPELTAPAQNTPAQDTPTAETSPR